MKMILGTKKGMTHIFREDGRLVPVTQVLVEKNYITGKRNEEKDGYTALQIGFLETRKANKPQLGQFDRAKTPDLKFLREVLVSQQEAESHKEGEQFGAEIFSEGEKVKVTGISKGKGYQGVIKRHGFRRGPMSHGSDHHREPGSIGSAYPQHVMKGTKLPGQTGRAQVSTKNLEVAHIDTEKGILYIKGAVPGPNKAFVMITGQGEFKAEIIQKSKIKNQNDKGIEKKEENVKKDGKTSKKKPRAEKPVKSESPSSQKASKDLRSGKENSPELRKEGKND